MGFLRSIFGGDKSSVSQVGQAKDGHGFVRGRHFTEWVDEVKQLKRDQKQHEVIQLCLEAVDATEAEQARNGLSVAPWWYDQVALAARRTGQSDLERDVMQRYLDHPGRKNPKYVEKFERSISKLDKLEGS